GLGTDPVRIRAAQESANIHGCSDKQSSHIGRGKIENPSRKFLCRHSPQCLCSSGPRLGTSLKRKKSNQRWPSVVAGQSTSSHVTPVFKILYGAGRWQNPLTH